jgi:hypothetical protein
MPTGISWVKNLRTVYPVVMADGRVPVVVVKGRAPVAVADL